MSSIIVVGTILGILGTIFTVIFLVILHIIKKQEIPKIKREVFVDNYLPQYSNGHSFGWEQSVDKLKNGLFLVKFYPIDQDKPIRDLQELVVNRITLPIGEKSGYKNSVYYLPKSENELSQRFNNTILGEMLSKGIAGSTVVGNLKRFDKDKYEAIQEGIKRLKGGEISSEEIKRLSEISFEAIRFNKEIKDDEKSKKEKGN